MPSHLTNSRLASSYTPVSRALQILLLALVYFVTAKIGQQLSIPPGNVTPIWIPSGIILAAVLLRGNWIWPGIFLGAFAGNVSAYIDFSSTELILKALFSGTMNGIGDTLGAVLAAQIIRHKTHTLRPYQSGEQIMVFLYAGVVFGAFCSAGFGVTGLAIAGLINWQDYINIFSTWVIGDAVGILILTPLLLSLLDISRSYQRVKKWHELIIYFVILILLLLVCLEFLQLPINYQLPLYLVLPVLMWSVLRLCEQITLISVFLVATISTIATAYGAGPFAVIEKNATLIELQLFLAVMSSSIIILNAVVRERQAINYTLVNTHKVLEATVEERTQRLKDTLKREKALNKGLQLKSKELELTQNQLLHSQKMEALGTLAGGIAHDFNNILNAIIGNAELAETHVNEDVDLKRYLSTITSSSLRAAKLVKQILTFSRMKSENYIAMNLTETVKEGIKLIRSTLPTNINIENQITDENIIIVGDETQIHQVMINLITNSYHAMEQHDGIIKVELMHEQAAPVDMPMAETECAHLRISDTGKGMAPDVLSRVFDPFFTTKDVGKGTGLGLSVVHGIIDSHKGLIKVESEPDGGTIFNIYLPITQQKIKVVTDDINQQQAKRCKTILLVDDEPEIVELYQKYLERQNCDVISTLSPLEAINIFKKEHERIDLVITDQTMPGLTGKELCKKMIDIKPTIKIILTTGYSDSIDEIQAKKLGISRFLNKPVQLSELKSIIENCFSK